MHDDGGEACGLRPFACGAFNRSGCPRKAGRQADGLSMGMRRAVGCGGGRSHGRADGQWVKKEGARSGSRAEGTDSLDPKGAIESAFGPSTLNDRRRAACRPT